MIATGLTLDAGGLIALDRGDRKMLVLLARARENGDPITVPAPVPRSGPEVAGPPGASRPVVGRQPATDLVALDGPEASAVGLPPC